MPTTTPLSIQHVSSVSNTLAKHSHTQRKRTVLPLHAQYLNALADDVMRFDQEAQKYREAGNLEETLSNTLLKGLALEHLVAHAATKAKTEWKTKLTNTEHTLGQLHTKLQSKMDYFHGCLDSESDDESSDHKLDCDSIRPIDVSTSNVSLASIVGNDAIKQDIINGIVQPFNQPLLFKMHRSFLFYGPPGTGKTMFAKASANSLHTLSAHMNVLFFAPSTDALKDKHVGGTEKKITNYFKCVQQQAAEHTNDTGTKTVGVIFIDEIDSLARSRDEDDSAGVQASATNTLLQMMDGFTRLNDVIVMAATNYPWQLDDAVLSRFQDKIYVRLPDTPTIVGLLKYNIKQFYANAIGLPNASQHHYDVLANVCGINDDTLTVLAKTFHTPTTYSPSNIKDVCQQVFRKSARQVHQHGVFYPVLLSLHSDAYAELSRTERAILGHINHKYASGVTYAKLRASYGDVFTDTEPVQLQPNPHSTTRPESITIHHKDHNKNAPTHYVHSTSWAQQRTAPHTAPHTSAFVALLNQLTQFHIYIHDEANDSAPVQYVLYKPFYALYGEESVSVFQMCGVGEFSVADRVFVSKYLASPVALLQRIVEPLLSVTPSSLLLKRVNHVYFKDTKTDSKHPFWSMDVRAHRKTLRSPLFHLSQYHNDASALDLQSVRAHTHSGVRRLALWALQAPRKADSTSEGKWLDTLHLHKLATTSPSITLQHIQDVTHKKSARVQQTAFSLHIDFNLFADAMNPDFHDAIRPTSNTKEIQRLERYWKGE